MVVALGVVPPFRSQSETAGAPGALWMDTDNNVATLTGPVTLASPTQIRLTALNTLTFSNTVTAANQPLNAVCTIKNDSAPIENASVSALVG